MQKRPSILLTTIALWLTCNYLIAGDDSTKVQQPALQPVNTAFTDNYFEEREKFLEKWENYTPEEQEKYKRDLKMFKRTDAFWMPRLQGTNGSIKEYNASMAKYLHENPEVYKKNTYEPCIDWSPIGVEIATYNGYSGIGRLTNVKFHNNYNGEYSPGVVPPVWDEGANTFYGSAPTGGLWKTENGGQDWFNLNTDFLPFIGVSEFELSRKNNNEIFIVSSTYKDQSKVYEGEWGSMSLFHSLDGGLTWNSCGAPFSADWSNYSSNRQYVSDLELVEYPVSSGLTDYLVVASELGVHKSTDHGQSWQNKLFSFNGNCSYGNAKFARDAMDNQRMYLTTSINYADGVFNNRDADSIYYSQTAGETWQVWQTIDKFGCDPTKLSLGLPQGTNTYISSNKVLVSHTNSQKIYVIAQCYVNGALPASSCNSGYGYAEMLTYLFVTTDKGATWTRLMRETTVGGVGKSHNGIFVLNPIDDDQIYLSRSMSTNSWNIAHWEASISNFTSDSPPSNMHADLRDVALKIVSGCGVNKLYALAGTDGGANLCEVNSTNLGNGGGNVWTNVTGTGLQVGQIYRHSASTNSKYITFGAADIGSWIRDGYGMYDWHIALPGDGMDCVYDYADDQTFYNTDNQSCGKIIRSSPSANGNTNVKPSTCSFLWVSPLEIDPNNHESILAGYDHSVYKSTTYPTSSNWVRHEILPFKKKGKTISTLAISPANSDVMFAASEWSFKDTVNNTIFNGARLYKTTDGGTTWIPSGDWWLHYISAIAIDPAGEDIYASKSGHHFWSSSPEKVMRSQDQGASWQNWSTGLPDVPVNCVIIDQWTKEVFIGTDYGVYRRKPTDTQWVKVGCGLPNVIVTDLSIAIGPTREKLLRASTYGRGMWEAEIAPGLTFEEMTPSTPELDENTAGNDEEAFVIKDKAPVKPISGKETSEKEEALEPVEDAVNDGASKVENSEREVIIFPNPTDGKFNVELTNIELQNGQLIVSDMHSNVVHRQACSLGINTVYLNVASGQYSVEVWSNDKRIGTYRVVVQ